MGLTRLRIQRHVPDRSRTQHEGSAAEKKKGALVNEYRPRLREPKCLRLRSLYEGPSFPHVWCYTYIRPLVKDLLNKNSLFVFVHKTILASIYYLYPSIHLFLKALKCFIFTKLFSQLNYLDLQCIFLLIKHLLLTY